MPQEKKLTLNTGFIIGNDITEEDVNLYTGLKTIALFMDAEIDENRVSIYTHFTDKKGKFWNKYILGRCYFYKGNEDKIDRVVMLADLEYHISWNELMPACRKFNYLSDYKLIPHSKEYEKLCDKLDNEITRYYDTKTTFPVLVECIEWYNKNKTS